MLVVKLEMHSAVTGQTTELGRCVIVHSEDVSDPEIGNYGVLVHSNAFSTNGALSRSGSVKNYPRLQLNVWRLVLRALKSAFPEESETTALEKAIDFALEHATGTSLPWLQNKAVTAVDQAAWRRVCEERWKLKGE